MKRSKIKDLLAAQQPNRYGSEEAAPQEHGPTITAGDVVMVQGWVKTRRASKNLSFIQINDGSTLSDLQVVAGDTLDNHQAIEGLTTGSSVSITGALVESPGKGQSYEVQAQMVEVLGHADAETYPLQKKRHTLEFLRDIGHLRPRTNTLGAVARVRSAMSFAIHSFFQSRGFLYVQTPIITASDAEGAGSMFRVTTLPVDDLPVGNNAVTAEQDFFGRPVHLTVSGQLEAEIYALALSDVYTFGPTFRAENSNTSRHLAEFWMVEPEVAFCDLNGLAELSEDFLKYIFRYVLDHCSEDMEFFQKFYDDTTISTLEGIVDSTFERLTYSQAVHLLERSGRSFEFPVEWGKDLQSEHERYLTEVELGRPVIVTDYPEGIKAFYMRMNDDGGTVAAMDVLVPRIGEIIGGSQREERLDVLSQRMKDTGIDAANYWWYLDLRRYGTVPHAGFGLGFERTLQFVTGMQNIRDVIAFPRTPGSAEF